MTRSSMGARLIPLNGDEEDALTSWRSVYCYLDRPGVVSSIKRRYRRRERRVAKADLRKAEV